MNRKIILRAGMLVFLAAVLCILLLGTREPVWSEEQLCLGVPLLPREEWEDLGPLRHQDHSQDLKIQGEFAAVDRETSTIYLSRPIGAETAFQDLTGQLSVDLPGYRLYFLQEDRWNELDDAVREGYGFRLRVRSPWNTCMEYKVVFTTLPLLNIDGQYTFTNENQRNVFYGDMVLWDPSRMTQGNTGVNSGHLQWHLRGGSSSRAEKKPWKLSLKNGEGRNRHSDLLGLGSDDDWILNPMNMEDSNVREKLFMDLWNELAAGTDHNYPMSRGAYVEVVMSGEYLGLYLLQRRVDDKYLDLNADSVLMKASQLDEQIEYEFVTDLRGREVSMEPIDVFFQEGDCGALVPENFVDVSLFLDLFSARDNVEYKNMFYVFDGQDRISLIPWDTDMSLGSFWNNTGREFIYAYEASMQYRAVLWQKEAMKTLYPELDQMLSRRWTQLRQELLTREHLFEMLDDWYETLDASGAACRDVEKWGLFYGGADTPENLYRFIEERLTLLDSYYAQ